MEEKLNRKYIIGLMCFVRSFRKIPKFGIKKAGIKDAGFKSSTPIRVFNYYELSFCIFCKDYLTC